MESGETSGHPVRSAPWSLIQYRSGGEIRRGALVDSGEGPGSVVELPSDLPGTSVLDLLAAWEIVSVALRGFSPSAAAPVLDATLVAPLTFPGAVLGAGANYYGHCAEMGVGVPDPDVPPFFFLKPPRTTVIGPADPIPYPRRPGTRLDWEAELGIVIGAAAKDVPAERAREHIAGFLVANDISARDSTARVAAVSPHFVYDWLAQKGQDGFCPLGPGVVPTWLVPDPQQLRIQLLVNGELKQDAKTDDMVVGVDRLVSGASRFMTLQPGDVILTGTPAGVGVANGEFLHPGDRVTVIIEGIGAISNQVVRP